MANESEVIVQACSVITVACSLGAASLLIKNKRKHSTWVKKYIRGRQQYGECNTLLPELAATEVVKCVLYMRMDIDIFEEFRRWSGRVVSFLNSTTRTRRLCPRLDQTHGQNPYMSRLNEQVYDQTKFTDLSETRANPTGLCRRPGSYSPVGSL